MCLLLSVFFIYAFLKIKDNVCLIPHVGILFVQAELFDKFLHGSTLEECYSAVASVANRWLDLLDVCKSLLGLRIKIASLKNCPVRSLRDSSFILYYSSMLQVVRSNQD